MLKAIDWLSERKPLNLVIVLTYGVLILVMHHPMENISVRIMEFFSWQNYEIMVATIAVIAALAISVFFIKKLLQHRHATGVKIAYLVTLLCLVFLHSQINLVLYVELIHTIEFGIFAVLIFPLTKRFGDTAFYTLLAAVIDEWYQYQVLPSDFAYNKYFDFNDVVLDLLGIGCTLVLLYAAGVNHKNYPPKMKWYQSPIPYAASVLTTIIAIMYQLSLMQTYGSDKKAWIILNQASSPQDFWVYDRPGSPIVFHVMQPLEGLIILALLLGFIFSLDYFARGHITAPPSSGEARMNPR